MPDPGEVRPGFDDRTVARTDLGLYIAMYAVKGEENVCYF